ncbi:helix-turn-helix transcriptional regulator [Dactylosporangium sp. NBC_01737]|uniref:winged helix-turn-helix transcriptional regulator n=1 Tax=Dactylosporangium sp. NBC_01737 TaxID=2975959 RepID=UPI002E1674DF|nr:helix-turn-helix transcriptional regulator [Dactylosporangium sp. NBC_01737]
MGASYYQFCPVAKTMELLDERWTMLVVRELVGGDRHFNDLRRGLPRMSPTLLSKRLQHLVAAGVAERHKAGAEVRYRLSPAGRELAPIVSALGEWGIRWIGHLGDQDLDPKILLWDMHHRVDHDAVPAGRTVIQFQFPAVAAAQRNWWLVLTPTDADVCDADPGFDVAVRVTADLRSMIEVWLGDLEWSDALRSGAVDIQGPEDLRRGVPAWFKLISFADVPRPARPERTVGVPAATP